MDSLTHIALGACIGDIMLGKKLGKKAILYGAIAQSIPDIDFIAGFFLDPVNNLFAHRGFTHSIICCSILSLTLPFLLRQTYRSRNISTAKWQLFLLVQLFTHIFIDAFNNYGVGWFEPFGHYRISFNALYVVDPFFTIAPAIITVILLLRSLKTKTSLLSYGAITISSLYLLYCTINKFRIDNTTRKVLGAQNIRYHRYFTTPTPLNNWLWYIVAETDSGYYTGYRSLFDSKEKIDLEYFPQNEQLIKSSPDQQLFRKLVRFSHQYYTLENWHDTLVFNDLRFGQVIGWEKPREKFAFHYYLNYPGNRLVVQRGRFAKWDRQSTITFLKRIRGN